MGSIVMTEIKVDNVVNVAGSGKPNFPVSPTHSSGSALSTLNTYQYDSTAKVVTVVSSGGNKYAIDGGDAAPVINLLRGVTYVFDQSASSNSGHPLRFKKADGSSFTVTASGTPGQSGATVTITVPTTGDMPASYYCTVHGAGMGNSVTTSVPKNGALVWDSVAGRPMVYIANEFKNIQLNTSQAAPFTWGGARGVVVGGYTQNPTTVQNVIEYYTIDTTGSSQDFGDLTQARVDTGAVSNGTRAVFGGGYNGGSSYYNVIDYITTATTGNAQDFGDMFDTKSRHGSASDGTTGLFAGGQYTGDWDKDSIDKITIATAGNAVDFGNLTSDRAIVAGSSNATRGVFAGGVDNGGGTKRNIIDYVTIATPGNATDFGDMTDTWSHAAGSGDATYALFAGGRRSNSTNANGWTENIDYITVATTGNAQDFGDLIRFKDNMSGCSNGTRACFNGGSSNTGSNVRLAEIDTVVVATPGNATDFGDLIAAKEATSATSGAAS